MRTKFVEHGIDALIVAALLLAIAFAVNQWLSRGRATTDSTGIQTEAIVASVDEQSSSTSQQDELSGAHNVVGNSAKPNEGMATDSPNSAEESPDLTLAESNADAVDSVALYLNKCAKCHGQTGHGDGPALGSLGDISGDLALTNLAEQSDQELFNSISFGKGTEMPPWSFVLPDDERWSLVDYIRTLPAE